MPSFKIGNRTVGDENPAYFIADIAANHDGQLARALKLIRLAKQAGAEAAKFQHFRAPKIVSDYGFRSLGRQISHQAKWSKSVYEVYKSASLPWEWTKELKECCDEEGIEFLSTPYDFDAVDMLDSYVPAFKIGSGDISWPEMLQCVAEKQKPVILSTGASDIQDVRRAVQTVTSINPRLALLQCNTNYTGSSVSFHHVHLNVLRAYQGFFPSVVIELSDHTPGHAAVLGAVALGGRIVEKHFTDDTSRVGPDHHFAMTPDSWREMVERTRELEHALGSSEKRVADNEQETIVIQRRCLRAARNLAAGTKLCRCDIEVLRPAPCDAIFPYEMDKVIGRRVRFSMERGEQFTWLALE
ncbi:MAG TPA: N-acetylneuraminate synthase family protein [Candidatus Acidoferrales bacterium]|nr:N-acetylneuraminate synthase family protein [Candidatus Acidoferrales bacterium]